MKQRTWIATALGALLVAAIVAAVVVGREASPASTRPAADPGLVTAPRKPARPPPPGTPRVRVQSPEMPPNAGDVGRAAYADAKAAGRPPGEAAFRATVRAFIEYNRAFAEAQAAREHLTVEEVEELTYLGFMVQATQRLSEVADITGRDYGDAEREQVAGLMRVANDDFKTAMRDAVARGADADERWRLIRDTEDRYRTQLFALTGLDADGLDGLLAGDLARTGAPIATEIPADIEPRPYVADQPRPTGGAPAPR